MIVRELVTLLGFDIQEQEFNEADRRIDGLKRAAQALGTILLSGVAARGLASFVKRASDVQETVNVIDTSFGASANAVRAWASETAGAYQRSEYQLQKFAGAVGAMTRPLLGSDAATAKLSTDIAQLSVDLSSFFNTTEQEALTALKSGLIGETEPMRRYGVVLTQAALQEFAFSQGVRQSVENMTEAQKLQLRYQFIMARTAKAQGDAVRTATEFANSQRGLEARLGDVAIKIGIVLLPAATKLVRIAHAVVDGFLRMAEGSRLIETALVVLGGIATVVGIKMLLPFLPAIAAGAALAAAIGAVIVAGEDLYQFFTGGVSVTGWALQKLGIDADRVRGIFTKLGQFAGKIWDAVAERVRAVASNIRFDFGGAVDWVGSKLNAFLVWVEPKLDALLELDIEGGLQRIGSFFDSFADMAGNALDWVGDKLGAFFDWAGPKLAGLLDLDVSGGIQQIGDFFDAFRTRIADFIRSPLGRVLMGLLGAWLGKKLGDLAGEKLGRALGELVGSRKIPGSKALAGWLGEKGGGVLGSLSGLVAGGIGLASTGGNIADIIAPSKSVGVPAGGGNRQLTISRNASITVNGTASAEQKEEFRRIYREEEERMTRDAHAALVPSYVGGGT